MFRVASKIIFVITILRIAAAVAAAAALAYGIYLALTGQPMIGLVWVVSAVTFGWVSHLIFGLAHLLASAAAGPSHDTQGTAPVPARNRYRGLRPSLGGRSK